MSTIVTRAGKGSPLTHVEVDANFTNLNTDKVEKTAAAITGGTINGTTIGATTPAAGTFTTLEATDTLTLNKTNAAIAKVWSNTNSSPIADLEFQRGTGTVWGDDAFTDYRVRASGGNFIIQSKNNATSTLDLLTVDETNNAIKFSPVGVEQMRVTRTASAVNYIQVTGAATGAAPVVSAQGSNTDIPLVLQPKGTGALQAQATTSTTAGGNARGANATDWQTTRNSASQVASASQSVIGGGANNTASGSFSAVVGGNTNTNQGAGDFIGGGNGNATASNYASVVGGQNNSANGFWNFIGGGFTNTGTSSSTVTTQTSATTSGSTAVTLAASNANIKVGQMVRGTGIPDYSYVAAISGTSLTVSQNANSNQAATSLQFFTPHGVVVGGGNNQATGSYSFIGGGGDAGTAANRNVASGDWSAVLGGRGGTTRGITGFQAFSACSIPIASGAGFSQSGLLVLGRQTTDATATALASDANTVGATNQVILPNNSAYFFTGEVISGVTGGGNTKGWTIEGVIKRGANAASTALVGTPTVTSTYADAGASTWVIAVTADTTNGGLRVTFTGQASTTIRTVCQIRTTEMTY